MAEEYERHARFQYRNNSNLVLHREGPVSSNEPTGEPESLVGRIYHKMGDCVEFTRPKMPENKPNKTKRRPKLDISLGQSVLNVKCNQGYQPNSSKTKKIYEQLLTLIQQILGDQPFEMLSDAANEIISLLRGGGTIDQLRDSIGNVTDSDYASLNVMCKELSDFDSLTMSTGADTEGVSLLFDEEDDDTLDVLESEIDDEIDNEITDEYEKAKQQNCIQLNEPDEKLSIDEHKIPITSIDSHWLQRELNRLYNNPEQSVAMEKELLKALQIMDIQECENTIVTLFNYENFDFCKKLLHNRWQIYYCTRLGQAQSEVEAQDIKNEMAKVPQGQLVLEELQLSKNRRNLEEEKAKNLRVEMASLRHNDTKLYSHTDVDLDTDNITNSTGTTNRVNNVDEQNFTISLETYAFAQGSQFMSNEKVVLPEGSERVETKEYSKVTIFPALRPDNTIKSVPISALPMWAQPAFSVAKIDKLNPVQSAVFEVAFKMYEENLLICAPTGAGKTNVAILAILNAIGETLGLTDQSEAIPSLGTKPSFLIAYISPMKSLVSEQTQSFSLRLNQHGIRVEELTGDVSVSRAQLEKTHIIVTTPEKFDVVTRKTGNEPLLERLRLVIIDEIHLLHDTRGPVLEAIVARLSQRPERVRLVGLSATLPNYEDVARFLTVNLDRGLFYFGSHFRPVPLEQVYYGVKEKKAIKRFNAINEILYQEVINDVSSCQILVFVHSRKETYRTAKFIKDTALSRDNLGAFISESSSREILASEASNSKSSQLTELLPFGLAIHHAGLERSDRQLVEDLFADKHIQVLVSTATLAWGVNLPAHTVIIKGTQVFSPEKGEWSELCPLHVTQMLGRAGRPQYDTKGKGVIITEMANLQFYLSLNNHQLPIESQLVPQLPNVINAEIASRNAASLEECLKFLKSTYLYVRLCNNLTLYMKESVDKNLSADDAARIFMLSALGQLHQLGMVRYEPKSETVQPTFLGTISSHYYLRPESISVFSNHLKPDMSDADLLRLFSLSYEFRYIPVREQEAIELGMLMEKVPIPIKGMHTEATSKIIILLQAYISRLKLEGYALVSEMTYIRQNATRIMRAFFEIGIKRGWANVAEKALYYSKCIEHQMWSSSLPLRQIPYVPLDVIKKLERKDFPFERYYDLSALELGELIRNTKYGELLFRAVHSIPKLDVQVYVQPLTSTRVAIELCVISCFVWDNTSNVHGKAERFWLLVEDVDCQKVLYYDLISISRNESEKTYNFTVPISQPLAPNYYLKIISDSWINVETCTSISFNNLILVDSPSKHTELLDLVPFPVCNMKNELAQRYLEKLPGFAKLGISNGCLDGIQTQIFECLSAGTENVLLCIPPMCGKRLCIDFAILERLNSGSCENSVIALMASSDKNARQYYHLYQNLFEGLQVALLDGDLKGDCNKFFSSHMIIGTPFQYDNLFRRWKSREIFQSISLFIVDNLHMVSNPTVGPEMEVSISRLRFAITQLNLQVRIIALSYPVGNASDISNWIGASKVFNFSTDARKTPLAVSIRSVESSEREERLMSILKTLKAEKLYPLERPCCDGVVDSSKKVIIFCTDAVETRITAVEIALRRQAAVPEWEGLSLMEEIISQNEISERSLVETLKTSIGYIHGYTDESEFRLIEILFACGLIDTIVVDQSVVDDLRVFAPSVIIKDTKFLTPIFTPIQLELPCIGLSETDYSPLHLLHLLSLSDGIRSSGAEFFPLFDTEFLHHFGPSLTQYVTKWYKNPTSTKTTAKGVVFTLNSLKDYYKTALFEALPAESALETRLEEHFNSEIVLGTIENQQDALDWLTWTLYYRRLSKNPNYYGLMAVTNEHLSDHLSELVENTLTSLEKMQLVEVSDTISPLNTGLVGAYYCLRCETIELFHRSIQPNLTRRLLITIICASCEIESLPLHQNEESVINRIARKLGLPTLEHGGVFVNPHFKASTLVEAHMNRIPLPRNLARDVQFLLPIFLKLSHALVDIISSNMWLTPALVVMETCQLVVQALCAANSPLMQLPHFDIEICQSLCEG